MRYYRGGLVQILHPAAKRQGGIISRTGYTGEDGFELSIGSDIALGVWQAILDLGRPLGLVPTGLGARDTLRLEAGMPLYGHELSEQIDPFQAGLGFACHLVGYDFPGRDALRQIEKGRSGRRPRRPGAGRPPRRPRRISHLQGRPASGPGHQRHLLAHARKGRSPWATSCRELAQPGTMLTVDIRGHQEEARVVELPFYRRNNKGAKK